jgi:ABC-type branched-subunit amino acid transport system substrate-binding protein
VNAILDAAASQRIVAVTDVGLSQKTSRAAVAELSRHGMATIGATVTADNMNLDTDNVRIKNFFRVGPTNTDEAHVAAKYIARRGFQRVMLMTDTTEGEDYADTLSKAFQQQAKVARTRKYEVPKVTDVSRDAYMRQVFAGMHTDICSAQPDLIYFAGRGTDLGSFLETLATDGACELTSVTVLSGDDASTLAGMPIKDNLDIHFEVLYTAFAHPDQWQLFKEDPALKAYRQNYADFVQRFTATHRFSTEDLRDGAAMIEHDAVAAAMRAALKDPSAEPQSIANFLANINCTAAVPGASGFIAFEEATGNQVNKAIPIVRINAGGSVTLADLDWSQRAPLATAPSCPA